MVLDRDWVRPTGAMVGFLVKVGVLGVLGLLVALAPLQRTDGAPWTLEALRWIVVAGFLVASLVPLGKFLFLASTAAQHRTFLALTGRAWTTEARPAPPFTPSPERRFLAWRWTKGTLPSCRVWVLRRRLAGPEERLVVLLGSPAGEDEAPVAATRQRLRRYVEAHARPVAGKG